MYKIYISKFIINIIHNKFIIYSLDLSNEKRSLNETLTECILIIKNKTQEKKFITFNKPKVIIFFSGFYIPVFTFPSQNEIVLKKEKYAIAQIIAAKKLDVESKRLKVEFDTNIVNLFGALNIETVDFITELAKKHYIKIEEVIPSWSYTLGINSLKSNTIFSLDNFSISITDFDSITVIKRIKIDSEIEFTAFTINTIDWSDKDKLNFYKRINVDSKIKSINCKFEDVLF
jgi:hypothetical protein